MYAEVENIKTKMKTKFQANAVYQTCLLLVCSFPKFCMPLNVGVASGS